MMSKNLKKLFFPSKYIVLLILFGTIVWSLTMVKSGLVYDFGMGFWGPNGHDGVWHISLANSLSQGKLAMPPFAGQQLKNYHIGFDLLLAGVHRLTAIPTVNLYFQVFPVLTSLSIGFLLTFLLKKWKWSNQAVFWSLFFVYFGGNLGYLVTLVRTGDLGGESMFWAQQAISTLVNPPYAMSLVFLLLGLILVEYRKFIFAGVIFGLLIQIKAYASIIALVALFTISITEFIRNKDISIAKTFLTSLLISIILFLPLNQSSGSLLVFKPFWFLETMMQFSDRVGWPHFAEAMINYKLAGNWVKAVAAYGLAFIIFWYGNMGTRFLAELYVFKYKKNKSLPDWKDQFLLSGALIGLVASMLFVQKGTAWNTIQFFYYSMFFASILAGYVFAGILKANKRVSGILIAGVVVFTLPTTFSTLKHYLPARPPAKISPDEIRALRFLKDQPEGIVLTNPFDRELAHDAADSPPRPLYLYESTSYISAFSEKPVFLEDEVNLEITGYEWMQRREGLEAFFESPSEEFLAQNGIKYLYLVREEAQIIDKLGLEVIFASDEVKILVNE